jgi:hypothetical protein
MRTHGYEMTVCHKSAIDGGALVMMCGRDEEPQPSAIAH